MATSRVPMRAAHWLRGSMLAVMMIVFSTAPVQAKNVCVTMQAASFGPLTYVLQSPKVPKAGKVASVIAVVFPGIGTKGSTPGVAHGTVYGRSDGKLRVGLGVQGLLASGLIVDDVLDDALLDGTFTGTNVVVLPNQTTTPGTWTRVDCKTLTLP